LAAAPHLALTPPRRDSIKPRAPNVYAVELSIGEEVHQELECARDLLRHAVPNADLQEILHRALRSLIRDLIKQKFAVTDNPGLGRAKNPDGGKIHAEVRRAVFLRSLGGCEHVGPNGRCWSRAFVEFDHIKPRAVGGRGASAEEVRLLCRRHNQYAAELFFGRKWRPNGESVKEDLAPYGFAAAPSQVTVRQERVDRNIDSFQNDLPPAGSVGIQSRAPAVASG